MLSKRVILLVSLSIWVLLAPAQDFDQLKQKMEDEFNEFKQQQEKKFDNFVNAIDQEFSEFLKEAWKEFDQEEAIDKQAPPKPPIIPDYKVQEREKTQLDVIAPVKGMAKKDQILPIIRKVEEKDFTFDQIELSFLGSKLNIPFDKVEAQTKVNYQEAFFADTWTNFSKHNYNVLLEKLREIKFRQNLNDWAYYKLLKEASANVYPDNHDMAKLYCWFLANKEGYKIKIGYTDNKVVLLLPVKQVMYNRSFLQIGTQKYYVLEEVNGSIYTYDADYKGADREISLAFEKTISLAPKLKTSTIQFPYRGVEYSIDLEYNQNLIDFYKDYPLTDMHVYLNTSVSPACKESINEQITKIIEGLSEKEAVSFLLAMVQNGFDYKTDQDQFGKEKYYFPEEILHYPYSDCEDRSVFFNYLVNELVGLNTIGLAYKGHFALGVLMPDSDPNHQFVTYNDIKYTIADPTYMNAPMGLLNPDFTDLTAELVPVIRKRQDYYQDRELWTQINDAGGYRGSNLTDIVKDGDGNFLVCGYYLAENGIFNVDGKSDETGERAFVAKFSPHGRTIWMNAAKSDNDCKAFNLMLGDKGDIYVQGTFTGNIQFDGNKVDCLSTDVFLMRLKPDGTEDWLSKGGLDKVAMSDDFIYLIGYQTNGEKEKAKIFTPDPTYTEFGLNFNEDGLVYVMGSFQDSPGLKIESVESFSEGGEFNSLEFLRTESEKELANNCETAISGLFAMVKLIRMDDVEVSGTIVQQAFDKYNPEFKDENEEIYENFGKLKLVRNSSGIIQIYTESGKSVVFDKIKIYNKSSVKVKSYDDGNAQVDVIDGVRVGKYVVWYDLNFVKLYRENGDLLFDYDDDHSQATVNLKKDILN